MKFSQPNITQREIDAVVRALQEGHLATGEPTRRFEELFKEQFGYRNVVAVNSGTSAMIAALTAVGVRPGDEVIVTAYSIMATANAILAVGATPVFCDIDRTTYNMDPDLVPSLLTEKTSAILPASIFGVPCDAAGIQAAAPNVPIIEDSIEALGSTRAGEPIGADVAAATFGFYPNKQITTCQGGVVVTTDDDLAERVRRLRAHGYGATGDLWNQAYGWNIRLPDPLAAMGCVQLERLDEMQHDLSVVATMYDKFFGGYRKQRVRPGDTATHFIYGVELPAGVDKWEFTQRMAAEGVPIRPYFNAMHRVKHVKKWYRDCPVTDEVGARTIALPFHHDLSYEEVAQVWAAFERSL